MRRDDPRGNELRTQTVETAAKGAPDTGHLVFDFTGLERPDVVNLSLILTARLSTSPGESVWVRALPWQTALPRKGLPPLECPNARRRTGLRHGWPSPA